MTVYVDALFALNGALNYLMLLGSARLGGAPICRGRFLASAALGGLYAVACVVPGLLFLSGAPMKCLVFAAMILCAFGWKKTSLKLGLLFLLLSFAFCGVVMVMLNVLGVSLLLLNGAAYYPVSGRVLVLTAAAVYLLARLVFSRLAEHTGSELVPVELTAGERTVHLTALRDTGNTLKDPVTGKSVLVAEWQTVRGLLPAPVGAALTAGQFARPEELLPQLARSAAGGRWRLIPYRTVGNTGGLLLAMRCDRVKVGKRVRKDGLVAFSPTGVSDGGPYTALIGGKA